MPIKDKSADKKKTKQYNQRTSKQSNEHYHQPANSKIQMRYYASVTTKTHNWPCRATLKVD